MDRVPLLVCGGPDCSTQLAVRPKYCSACRCRAYCGAQCQRADWPVHQLYCVPRDQASDHDKICTAYNKKHRFMFLLLAQAFLKFDRQFGHLQGPARLAFLTASENFYLQVILQTVPNPPPGRHNRVRLAQAGLRSMEQLPQANRVRVLPRLEQRFPAFTIAFIIIPPGMNRQTKLTVTTVTHSFEWPPVNIPFPPPTAITSVIQILETIAKFEAMEEESAHPERQSQRSGN